MAYVSREDGERFVIPSYRDILTVKKQSLLKQEILLLSESYGAYITLHKKAIDQYEIAFSPETGYLLGETVWHYFKRPADLIYCEALPNTGEAILVIVKSGSVYLDGRFPLDSIPEELVVFLTQTNNFDIYVYGDVPISQTPEAGKLSFDASHVNSFNVLTESAFAKLPRLKAFQLQLVDTVLKAYGIGAFPIKNIILISAALGLLWMGWIYLTSHKKELPKLIIGVVNPYQVYINALTSPAPDTEIKKINEQILLLFSIPGWNPTNLTYEKGKLAVELKSLGINTALLLTWAKYNNFNVVVTPTGFSITTTVVPVNRLPPKTISQLDQVIANLVDRVAFVLPGNSLKALPPVSKGQYSESQITISFTDITPVVFTMLGDQLTNLPLTLTNVSISFSNGFLTGTIKLVALGS